MNKLKPNLGECWITNLNPTIGHEQAKIRLCLIISTNTFNHGPADLVVILPITTKMRKIWWHVKINPPEGGLKKTSFIICNQIRTISKQRLQGKPLGKVNPKTINEIEKRIKILLEL